MDVKKLVKSLIELMPARLRAARLCRGYHSRTAFALACSISLTTYRAHEAGEIEMRASDVLFYAKMLNISIGWLLTGEGSPFDHYKAPPSLREQDDLEAFLQ